MRIGILGTGAFGIALMTTLYENGHDITMWTKFENERDEIIKTRENHLLKGIKIPNEVKITTSLEEVALNKDIIIIAIPVFAICEVTKLIKPYIKEQIIINTSKGIEKDTCLFISNIVKKHIKTKNYAVISGPTFAVDIVSKLPVGMSLATNNKKIINKIKLAFQNNHVKLRETADVKGVEICGAVKNVAAIGAGILDGLGANESTKAMYLTEVLNDIKHLIKNLGGKKETILSFAGFGDILMTSTASKSRNYTLGKLLGQGKYKEFTEYKNNTTVEGLYTLDAILKLVNTKKIDIQIIYILYEIIHNNKDPKSLLDFLIEK